MTDLVERLLSRAWEHRHHRKYRAEAAAEIKQLRAELLEQARIVGMSGERELKLRAELAAAVKAHMATIAERDALKFACEVAKKSQPDPDAAVREEVERLRAEQRTLRNAAVAATERAENAEAERDALREDAERYRWLKERGGEGPLMKMACAYSHSSKTNFSTPLAVLNAMTADDAIDAAREKA